ncbi:MAG: class II fructose-bisphosphate aldolase [Clostridia bacterium]|nr:class II fructose-bisphosphate aldolase [Clostridia bacterium]
MRLYALGELLDAFGKPGAVAAFNFIDLDDLKGIVAAAEEEHTPVVIQVSQSTARSVGVGYMAAIGRAAAQIAAVPLCLHLDHASDFDLIVQAVCAGFSSVMVDGSHLPFPENVAFTKEVVKVAHAAGISVEAELGRIGGKEDTQDVLACDASLADPDEAREFVRLTRIDALAPAVGTSHGLYKGEPHIRFDLIEAVRDLVSVPLVLHGGSDIPREMVRRAIDAGIRKFNVATDLQVVHANMLLQALAGYSGAGAPDMRKLHARVVEGIRLAAQDKIRMCMWNPES